MIQLTSIDQYIYTDRFDCNIQTTLETTPHCPVVLEFEAPALLGDIGERIQQLRLLKVAVKRDPRGLCVSNANPVVSQGPREGVQGGEGVQVRLVIYA